MKKNTAYTIGSLVILLICAFCFVILPAMTGGTQSQEEIEFGRYDGKKISLGLGTDMNDFAEQYANFANQLGMELNSQTKFDIYHQAFNSTVSKYAYQEAVKDSGFVVTSLAVKQRMIPNFLDENGNFSSDFYDSVDVSIKEELRDNLEDQLYTTRFTDDLFGSDSDLVGLNSLYGIKESEAELDFIKDFNKSKRGFNIAYFPLSEYPTEEVVKYGKTNADKFNLYNLSVITVEDEATAKTVTKRLNNNEITFEDAVVEYSKLSYGDSTGKLANLNKYQLEEKLVNKEDIKILNDLPKDSISSPIETTAGFSIFKVNSPITNADFTLTSTIETVRNYLYSYESTILEDYFIAKANTLINVARSSDFVSACGNLEVANSSVAPFPLNYGNVSVAGTLTGLESVLGGAATNENFLKTAFSLKMNEISKPLVVNKNVVVLQYTTEEIASEDDMTIFSGSDLENFDHAACQNFVLNSDKLENNFVDVYFKYLDNSSKKNR